MSRSDWNRSADILSAQFRLYDRQSHFIWQMNSRGETDVNGSILEMHRNRFPPKLLKTFLCVYGRVLMKRKPTRLQIQPSVWNQLVSDCFSSQGILPSDICASRLQLDKWTSGPSTTTQTSPLFLSYCSWINGGGGTHTKAWFGIKKKSVDFS